MSWLPGWTSIESSARWEEFFFWLGIVFLVLVAGSELLSKFYGWRKDTLVAADQLRKIKETDATHSTAVNALQQRLDEASRKATPQQSRLTWRTITWEQRNILIGILRSSPKGPVTVMTVSQEEPFQFADQITEVLRAAGFTDVQKKADSNSIAGPGEWILVLDRARAPLHAVALKDAFNQIGIDLFGLSDPKNVSNADAVIILIGERKSAESR